MESETRNKEEKWDQEWFSSDFFFKKRLFSLHQNQL
jgi:hypothetical protein